MLRNTGRKAMTGEVYNHNFLALDGLPPGPGLVITLPFPVLAGVPARPEDRGGPRQPVSACGA